MQDHSAALELVSVYKSVDNGHKHDDEGDDVHMSRVTSLLDLHTQLKSSHKQKNNADLKQARNAVDDVLQTLEKNKDPTKHRM